MAKCFIKKLIIFKDEHCHSAHFIPFDFIHISYHSRLINKNVDFVRVSQVNMLMETKSPTPTLCENFSFCFSCE